MRGTISTGISHGMTYLVWEAAIAAGATLDELFKLEEGGFPKWFKVKLIAWFNLHNKVQMIKDAAAAAKAKKKK